MPREPAPKRGLAVVISGPSGVGKSSVCAKLLEQMPDATWSVSATTRNPRRGEQDGVHYCFRTEAEFRRQVEAREFLEYAEYQGHLYGTPEAPVRRAVDEGKVILLEIDVQGAVQLARRMPESVRVFLLPPSDEELRRRLSGRSTETPQQQAGRLEQALTEIAFARSSGVYQYLVINDTIRGSAQEILEIIEKERNNQ